MARRCSSLTRCEIVPTKVIPLDDSNFAKLREEIRRRAIADVERQAPEYLAWLTAKLDGLRSVDDSRRIEEDMRVQPLPAKFQGKTKWRDLILRFHEVSIARDDLAVSLHIVENPPAIDLGDVLLAHEFEYGITKYESLVDLVKMLVKVVTGKSLPGSEVNLRDERERLLGLLDGLSVRSLRDVLAHSLLGRAAYEEGETWLIVAANERKPGQEPALRDPIDYSTFVPGLRTAVEQLNAAIESVSAEIYTLLTAE